MEKEQRETPDYCKINFHEELSVTHQDSFIRALHIVIRFSVKVLALLMVLVILWGIGDVVYVLWIRLLQPPFLLLRIQDILETFGAFMAVLIAIEIFINIRLYVEANKLPVRLVVATALMAISRKVIIMDFTQLSHEYVFGVGTVVIAVGLTYFLVVKAHKD